MALTAPTQPTWTPGDTGGQLAVAPEGSVADNIFIFASAESPTGFVRRVIDGTYRASWAGIFAGGVAATNAARLNAVLANTLVKEVVFDTPEGGDIPLSGTVTFTNKVITLAPGSAFTGTYTLASPAINAPYTQVIFKGTPTITAPQSVSGKFSAAWWGALPDNTDISAKLTLANAAVNTSFQKEILFPVGSASNYLVSSTTTISSAVGLSFERGAILNVTGALNGGVILSDFQQQIFTAASIVNPSSTGDYWISAGWFGASASTADNQPCIQSAISVVNRNKQAFSLVQLPGGSLTINNPIACADFNTGASRYEQVYLSLKGIGEGFSNKSAGVTATRIVATFKDRPILYWQIGKGGGAQSMELVGAFTNPTMTDYEFYSSTRAAYNDPTCRNERYSPYCGIAIDPVRYTGVPPDGGYPGMNYNAPGNSPNSGSTGLYFSDIKISNVTVGTVVSPNGQTQNADCIRFDHIQVSNTVVNHADCQDQEKANIYYDCQAWGSSHTIFNNTAYGVGTAGNVYIEKFNIAGRNNTFIDWAAGGRFGVYMTGIYAESIGKFGSISSSAPTITVRDSEFRFVTPADAENFLTDYHVEATINCLFDSVVFDTPGYTIPLVLKNSSGTGCVFSNCSFGSVPVNWVEEGNGSYTFNNCNLTNGGRMGMTAPTYAQLGSLLKTWSSYGAASIYGRNAFNSQTILTELKLNSPNAYKPIRTKQSTALTVSGTRTATVTVDSGRSTFHLVGSPVYFQSGSTFMFGGIISSINSGTDAVNIQYIPPAITSTTYTNMYALCPLKMYGGIGNISASGSTITNYVASLGIAVGDLLVHSVFFSTGCAMVTNVTGSTITVNVAASYSLTGAVFNPPGVKYKFTNPYNNADSGIFPAGTLMAAGDIIESQSYGYTKSGVVTKGGYFDAAGFADTRQAEWCFTSLPTIIDRFYPGDPGKPANGASSVQYDILKGVQDKDFTINIGGEDLPYNSSAQLSYTFAPITGTISFTNGALDSTQYVIIKGR